MAGVSGVARMVRGLFFRRPFGQGPREHDPREQSSGKTAKAIGIVILTGRLQRQCRRAFIAHDGKLWTSELAEWCWPLGKTKREQVRSQARAAKSIGAYRVRRGWREWLWRLDNVD